MTDWHWPGNLVGVNWIGLCAMGRQSMPTPSGVIRGRWIALISRLWRWEFWPSWLFYLPLIPWLAYLALRYRSLTVWTAANPGIPQSGVVGESKFAILQQLPSTWVIPSFLIPAKETARMETFRRELKERGWSYPLILKPDAAQRGAGVKKVHADNEVEEYLQTQPADVIVQIYHPGPHEVGIFYYRIPGESEGRIFSITDKVFPRIVGDGISTLEELIWNHPRYRMQAGVFLARHQSRREDILPPGEEMTLALAGNHCQGTLFQDGARLITPELEQAVEHIARAFPGFYIGRFDVRYSDVTAFLEGRDLGIVELNGATGESTNIYDPSWSLLQAYQTLYRQWALLYRIGNANWKRGHPVTTLGELLRTVRRYYRERRINPLAD